MIRIICLNGLLLAWAATFSVSFHQVRLLTKTWCPSSFLPKDEKSHGSSSTPLSSTRLGASSETAAATLTEETTWNLRLVLQNAPTYKGKITNQIFVTRVKFLEEQGYEPPQGVLQQVQEGNDDKETQQEGQFTVASSRWMLSEDPNDRKDSLWVWGLFKEPLYPFLLLQVEVNEIILPGEDEDSIPPLKLFAQINHRRENGKVILSSGADLKIRKKETIKADPFGAATVDIFEDILVGKLQLQPIQKK